ncbi:hypothetical protein P3T27_007672 [Kitasatospora sp. MAA19]|uniref:hypothetical protein n=1 Tax=unclassified Kitasatospora TaxID=2633591 RepID=UPI0024749D6E|nr:hypothetical protein [Kitasatospora sp. MAA19]MDH6710921.1 hypothetical protein [Kitasatospora sp. MAA19]
MTVPGIDVLGWGAHALPYLAGLAAAGGGGWLWAARRRLRRCRAALARRTVVEVVPTSAFDPGEGEVARFGRHLARVHHAAGGVPARGAAVRVRYSAEGGRMHCYLEGPAAAAAVLAMPGFTGVEVHAAGARSAITPVRFTTQRDAR